MIARLLLGERDFASSHEFADCFNTFFGRGLHRLAFFGARGFGSFAASFTPFLDGDCVASLLFRGERETLRLLASLPTVLTPFLDGDCIVWFLFGGERLCFFSRVCRLF